MTELHPTWQKTKPEDPSATISSAEAQMAAKAVLNLAYVFKVDAIKLARQIAMNNGTYGDFDRIRYHLHKGEEDCDG